MTTRIHDSHVMELSKKFSSSDWLTQLLAVTALGQCILLTFGYNVPMWASNTKTNAFNLSELTCKQECIPVGCVPSAAVAVSRGGGGTWSGGVPGLGGLYLPGGGGLPGLGVYLPGGCTWSWGVYLVRRGCTCPGGYLARGEVYLVWGCTWSRGVYLAPGGVPGPGGCTWSGTPPLWTDTRL